MFFSKFRLIVLGSFFVKNTYHNTFSVTTHCTLPSVFICSYSIPGANWCEDHISDSDFEEKDEISQFQNENKLQDQPVKERQECGTHEYTAQGWERLWPGASKPEIIMDYNVTRGGVDNMDTLVTIYSCKSKTLHWPLVIFFDILDISVYNAFVIWVALKPEWNRRELQRKRLFSRYW